MVGLLDLITDVMQKVVGRQSSKSMLANHGKSVLQLMLCTLYQPLYFTLKFTRSAARDSRSAASET